MVDAVLPHVLGREVFDRDGHRVFVVAAVEHADVALLGCVLVDPPEEVVAQLLGVGGFEALDPAAGRIDRAEWVLADIEQTLNQQRKRLEQAGITDKPVALVNFMDDRHVRIYAPNGLFQTALDNLGLTNAWSDPGNYWGFSAIGLESVADARNSRIVVIEPLVPGLADSLANSPFWTYLPPVQNDEIYRIPAAWPFGGVYPVKRLAIALTNALIEGGSDNVRR